MLEDHAIKSHLWNSLGTYRRDHNAWDHKHYPKSTTTIYISRVFRKLYLTTFYLVSDLFNVSYINTEVTCRLNYRIYVLCYHNILVRTTSYRALLEFWVWLFATRLIPNLVDIIDHFVCIWIRVSHNFEISETEIPDI